MNCQYVNVDDIPMISTPTYVAEFIKIPGFKTHYPVECIMQPLIQVYPDDPYMIDAISLIMTKYLLSEIATFQTKRYCDGTAVDFLAEPKFLDY